VIRALDLNLAEVIAEIDQQGYGRMLFWDDFAGDRLHVIKYFLGGMFITITMTGLDQDMMQKNLSCKNLRDAQKNMTWFSLSLVPVNILFLFLGALLLIYSSANGITLPALSDDLFPMIATQGYLPSVVTLIFIVGLTAAAFSSADSALTALTTSITVDMLGAGQKGEASTTKTRYRVHIILSVVMLGVILLFRALNNKSIIDTVFTIAGYTYGPLLGLYAFGMFTKIRVKDRLVPWVVLLSPVLTWLIQVFSKSLLAGYVFGFELLLINGLLTMIMLWAIKKPGLSRLND